MERMTLKIEEVRDWLGVKPWGDDAFNAVIPRLLAGEDSVALANAALCLLWALFDEDGSRARLTLWCCVSSRWPLVAGRVLQGAWITGKFGSILRRYTKTDVMRWFESASKMTLMTKAERAVLAALPEIVTAYRGGTGTTPRKLAAGLSWALDPDGASFSRLNTFSARPARLRQIQVVTGHVRLQKPSLGKFCPSFETDLFCRRCHEIGHDLASDIARHASKY
jgi:hypothetical protein